MSGYLFYYGALLFFICMILYWTIIAKRRMKYIKANPNDLSNRYFVGSNLDYYGGIIGIIIIVIIALISMYNQIYAK